MNALPFLTATPTVNYTGPWAKLTAAASYPFANVTQDSSNPGSDSNLLDIVHVQALVNQVDNGNGSFDITFGADTFCYGLDSGAGCIKQANSIVAEFSPDIDLTLSTISDGEVSSAVGQVFTPDGSGNLIRFGRLVMDNVFGSELVNLIMPMKVEYFNGANFIINDADSCTTIASTDLAPDSALGSPLSLVNPSAASGVLNIRMTAPGAGNTGETNVLTNLLTSNDQWLQFDWDGDTNHDNNPTAKATFGIYSGNSRQIYYRQIYQ
jgi:MSHA biogenesis protein MshQ